MPRPSTPGIPYLARHGGTLMSLGVVARLPTAMIPMLLLVGVPHAGGDPFDAGAAVGAVALGSAVGGVVLGVLVDRGGARAVIGTALLLHAGAVLGLAVQIAHLGTAPLLLVPLAALAGLSNPAIGSLTRAAWPGLLPTGARADGALRSALSWEAAADEAGFVIAPILSSLLVLMGPPGGVLLGVALIGVCLHAAALIRAAPHLEHVARSTLLPDLSEQRGRCDLRAAARAGVLTSLVVVGAVGVVFGTVQVSVHARLADLGAPSLTGVVYGALGVGSIAGGLVWAQVPNARRGTRVIPVGGLVLLVLGLVGSRMPGAGPAATGMLCAALGIWVSPMLAEAYGRAEEAVSAHARMTVMTALSAGTGAGVGVGAPLASVAVGVGGATAGYLGVVLAGGLILLGGGASTILDRRPCKV